MARLPASTMSSANKHENESPLVSSSVLLSIPVVPRRFEQMPLWARAGETCKRLERRPDRELLSSRMPPRFARLRRCASAEAGQALFPLLTPHMRQLWSLSLSGYSFASSSNGLASAVSVSSLTQIPAAENSRCNWSLYPLLTED